MMPRPAIFISAVSSELSSARQLVANTLHFLGHEGVWQDVFGTEQGDLREMLRRRIDDCAGVIQLVGKSYGFEPPAPDPQFGRVSYTQYEALYAHHRGKPVWYLFLDEGFPTTGAPETDEKRQLQQAYQARVKAEGQLRHKVASNEALESMVLKLRDDLAHLRRRGKQWAAAVIVLLLLLAAGMSWMIYNQGRDAKLLQAARELAQTMSQNAQAGQKVDDASLLASAYGTLEARLNLQKGSLEKDLPTYARKLLANSNTSPLDRANALFVTRQFADAEKAALDAKDKVLAANVPSVTDAINAFELAGLSADAQSQYARALDHYRAAAALTDQNRDAAQWARIQSDVADALVETGQLPDSATTYQSVLNIYQRNPGPEAPATLAVQMNLATVLAMAGKFPEAESDFRKLLPAMQRVFGVQSANALKCDNNLANVLRAEGKFDDAVQEYNQVIAAEKTTLGLDNPDTLRSETGLADTLNYSGKTAAAEPLYRAVLASQERVLGADSPDTLHSKMGLADTLTDQGKAAEAETDYRAVLTTEERLGPDNPETITCRMGLAIALVAQGKFADAETEFQTVVTTRQRVLGPDHPDTLAAIYNFAFALAKDKKYAEALDMAKRAEAGYMKIAGPESPNTKNATNLRQSLETELKQ